MNILINLIYIPLILVFRSITSIFIFREGLVSIDMEFLLLESIKVGLTIFSIITLIDLFMQQKQSETLVEYYFRRGLSTILFSTIIISILILIIPRAEYHSFFYWICLMILGELTRTLLSYLWRKRT